MQRVRQFRTTPKELTTVDLPLRAEDMGSGAALCMHIVQDIVLNVLYSLTAMNRNKSFSNRSCRSSRSSGEALLAAWTRSELAPTCLQGAYITRSMVVSAEYVGAA